MDSSMKTTLRQRMKRSLKRPGGSRHLQTDRDLWLLGALAKMRFLTTRQIACLLFGGSQSAANKRLRKLLDNGCVRVWVPNLNRDNIYGLAPQGRSLLLNESEELEPALRCPGRMDGRIEHLLAINSVRIALAIGLPGSDGELMWWRSDWELRAHSRQRTIPDALFVVRWPDVGDQVFALEVEHGTRAPRSFQGKLLRYGAAARRPGGIYGETNPIVLVIGHSPTWLARYRAAVAMLPLPINVGFAALDEIERHGPVGIIWQARAGNARYSLRTLATLPCRKERLAPETHGETPSCATGAAHEYPYATTHETA